MKVGYIGGFWQTNIGNSFYNLGALWLLEEVFGKENVFFVSDPPQVYWPTLKNDYDVISRLDLDLVVISGPILGTEMINIYSSIFDKITARGGRIGFISAGSVNYTEKEADIVSQFLKKYPIAFVFTRDRQTFDLYSERLNTVVYDGLCTSMFLKDAVTPAVIKDDYVVFNFSHFSEPEIDFIDNKWLVKKNIFQGWKRKWMNYPIVRTRNAPFIPNVRRVFNSKKFVYPSPNMYFSSLPYGYLSILKSSRFIFSDRVHTCAAGLIYGAQCMYFKTTKRAMDGRNNLFLRLKVPGIYERPVALDLNYIETEKAKMKNELSLVLARIQSKLFD